MQIVRLAMLSVAVAVAAVDPAAACAFNYGNGWTATGGGNPGELTVLGGETCTGSVRGDGLRIIAPPQHGKIKVTGPSSYAYTPNRAFRGTDTFNVSIIMAGIGLVVGTVAVTVH
jgi:Big-like domain-containing protein